MANTHVNPEDQQASDDLNLLCIPCMVVYARMLSRQAEHRVQEPGDEEVICPKCREALQRLQAYFLKDYENPLL